jgi:uncharacterized protein (TIGR00269 family)
MINYSQTPLCKEHFLRNIEDRVRKTIEKHHLIEFKPEEKVLVAISGGKDSQTLLTLLDKVFQKRIQLEALYIELGIAPGQYSKDSAIVASELCRDLNIPYHQINIKDEIGFSIDDVHELGEKYYKIHRSKSERFRGECSYCGLIKRYTINRFAALNHFSKVATGHNLTDESTQLIGNFFTSDIELMARSGPSTITEAEMLVPRVKPLYYIYETEMILYAFYAKVKHVGTECPYVVESPMMKVKSFMEKVEGHRRGTMLHMMRKYHKKLRPVLFEAIPEHKMVENNCIECGMTTNIDKCAFCRMKNRMQNELAQLRQKSLESTE